MDLSGFLKLNTNAKKGTGIGMFISPASTIEVVEYDFDREEITNYLKQEFEYDSILREINVDNFEITLQNILRDFDISPQTPIVLSIPNIFINKKVLPLELEPEETYTALVSETEKNYIFKKSEPKVSWNVISTDKENSLNTVIFSALQKNLVERLEDVFKRQGLKLVSIESSYPSFIRGLSVTGLVDDYIENNLDWCVLIVKNNINAVITLTGEQVTSVTESPLALKSLDVDDLYPNLASSIQGKIQDTPVSSMVIVNYSTIIDSTKLAGQLNFNCPFIEIEDDSFENEPLFPFAAGLKTDSITPEAMGAAYYKNAPVKFSFNFSSLESMEVEVPDFLANIGVMGNPVHLVLLALIAVAVSVVFLTVLIFIPVNSTLQDQYRKLYVQCEKYKESEKPVEKVFNLYSVVQNGFQNNEKIVTSYDAISAVIPEKVWVTSVSIDENLNADITGKAYSIEDIVNYYQNLLSVAKFSNFKIKSIKVVGDSVATDASAPDVSVNTINDHQKMNLSRKSETLPSLSSSELPPPPMPSSSGLDAPIPIASDAKYYEFNFGNSSSDKIADDKTAEKTDAGSAPEQIKPEPPSPPAQMPSPRNQMMRGKFNRMGTPRR